MKKGRQGVSSPRSEDLQTAALPKFVQVGDRQGPIFPLSVLLELAKLVERIRARQADAAGLSDSKDSTEAASVGPPRPKRRRTAQSDDQGEAAARLSPGPRPTTRPKVARPRQRQGGTH
jgi:hypothetical protein